MTIGFVVGQVHDLPHLEPHFSGETVDDIDTPFAATILRFHGVQHDGAICSPARQHG